MSNETNARCSYRLPPCPAYDVEGMERWLSDLAEKGLLLTKDGIFAGVACFEKAAPRRVKYRLEAAQKSTNMWAADGGEPDLEQVALSEKYAWEYVAKRGDFYIYRSYDLEARELNTDPQVQALALNAVKKRQRSNTITLAVWLVVYPLLFLRGGLLLTVIQMRTWLFLLTAALVLWLIADEVAALVNLHRLQKKLRENGCLQTDKNWRRGAVSHHGKRAAKFVLAVFLICVFLSSWSDSVMDTDKVQLDQYSGTLPFASMRDFTDSEIKDYRMTMTGLRMGFNSIREWSDYLAPRCIDYNESAEITLRDGRILDGGYNVDYYEARTPAIAARLVKEMYRIAGWEKYFEPLELPELEAEYDALYAYRNGVHFPTILLQSGNKVIRAFFYQTSENFELPLEAWANAIAESLASENQN